MKIWLFLILPKKNVEDLDYLLDMDVADNIEESITAERFFWTMKTSPSVLLSGNTRTLEEDADSESEISYISLSDDVDGRKLFSAYKSEIRSESVTKSVFEIKNPDSNVYENLVDRDFLVRKQESRDVYITLRKLIAHKMAIGMVPNYVVGLNDISDRDFRQGIIGCLYRGEKGLLEDIASLPMDWYEKDLSCVVRTDDDLTGFLLIRRFPSGVLMPVLFYAVGPNYKMDLVNMLRHSIQKG